ncbi:MAG: 4Fe-4S binding protein [Phycisphaerae bacterium]|nr:4Fe-4S binding protein [Phycisphaerae bacterium]
MKELVIVSGKGGTGKTSVAASLAMLANRSVIADCDVDAADLHLVLSPQVKERYDFYAGHKAVIRPEDCIECGACLANCRFGAVLHDHSPGGAGFSGSKSECENCDHCERSCSIRNHALIRQMQEEMGLAGPTLFRIDPLACEGCGVCVRFCPVKAIDFPESLCGEWMVSDTRCGPMVHARLGIAAENSGKLVSLVRTKARQIAENQKRPLVIIDGPPGIGCPVIASVTGCSQALIVTEPTVSGIHDLERVISLTNHFAIRAAVCVNRWDLNPEMTGQIEHKASQLGARIVGRIRYDRAVTQAQMQARAVVETDAPSAEDIRNIWNHLTRSEC